MEATDVLIALTALGCQVCADGDALRVQDPHHVLTDELRQAIHQHKTALLTLLHAGLTPTPDAQGPGTQAPPSDSDTHVPDAIAPCPHARTGRRGDGTEVCIDCAALWRPGNTHGEAQPPITYCPTAHVPYDPTLTEGPARQCRHCPHVWRVPCACAAVTWKFVWQDGPPLWFCLSCGAVYGSDRRVTATHTAGCSWRTGASTRCTCDPVLTVVLAPPPPRGEDLTAPAAAGAAHTAKGRGAGDRFSAC